jgi:peptide chain release factor 3
VEVKKDGEIDFAEFKQTKSKFLAKDKQRQLVYLADSAFSLEITQSKYPGVIFHATSEF